MIRKYFVETKELPYAMGQAAAETLQIGDEGGKKAGMLFSAMGLAGIFAVLRDWFCKIPVTWFSDKMLKYGSYGGLYISPMLVAIGYIVGPIFIGVWFFRRIDRRCRHSHRRTKAGLLNLTEAASIKQSLGIGMMVGTGVGILVKGILPKAKENFWRYVQQRSDWGLYHCHEMGAHCNGTLCCNFDYRM